MIGLQIEIFPFLIIFLENLVKSRSGQTEKPFTPMCDLFMMITRDFDLQSFLKIVALIILLYEIVNLNPILNSKITKSLLKGT